TIVLITANLISLALGLFINIYVARYFTPDNYGILSAALNLAMLFTIFTDLGVSRYLTLEVARKPGAARDYINSSLFIKLVLVMVTYGAILITAYVSGFSDDKLFVVAIIGIYMMLVSIAQIFQAYFQSIHAMEHIAICYLINPVILLIGIAYIIITGEGIVALAMLYLTSGVIVLVYTIAVFIWYTREMPKLEMKLVRPIIAGGLPLSLGSIFYFIYYKIDIQMIDYLKGSVAVGYYSAAYKLVEAVICIPSMISMATFPLISYYFFQNDSKLGLLLNQVTKYLFLLGLPIMIGTFLLADKFIFLCYQDKYAESIDVLKVLSAGLLLLFISSVQGDFLAGSNMQKAAMYINAIAAVFNVGLNFLVIPVYGIVGSAYTVVVTQLIILMMNVYMVRKSGHHYDNLGVYVKITLCGLAMGGLVYVLHGYNLILIVILAAVFYSVLIVVTRSIARADIEMIVRIVPGVKKIPIFR
ncbi:MAG TPA: flippase, partial [Methanocella sp.]